MIVKGLAGPMLLTKGLGEIVEIILQLFASLRKHLRIICEDGT